MKAKFIPLILSTFLSSSLFADVMMQDAKISIDGKDVGKIEILTPVEVISKNGAKAKIKIKGAVSENYTLQMQKSVKVGEIYLTFDKENELNFKKIKKLEDDYGEIWYESEGVYEVDTNAITTDVKPLYQKATKIYEETCSACHRLHEPNSFTANQWPANLQGMVDANYVALEPKDLNLVKKYLQHNAKTSE